MKARAIISFTGFGITMSKGQETEIDNEKVFLDLAQAGFVEQVDSKPTKKPRTE